MRCLMETWSQLCREPRRRHHSIALHRMLEPVRCLSSSVRRNLKRTKLCHCLLNYHRCCRNYFRLAIFSKLGYRLPAISQRTTTEGLNY